MKRTEANVRISRIIVDRTPLDSKTLRYALDMSYGVDFPAIKVAKRQDGRFEIRDGRHRITAAKLTGREFIKAKYSEEPIRSGYEAHGI